MSVPIDTTSTDAPPPVPASTDAVSSETVSTGTVSTEPLTTDAAPFDGLAADYDAAFTGTLLGRLLREAVWEEAGGRFGAGDRVLDLGCGTGEDARWLARRGSHVHGIDASERMVARAREKAAGTQKKAAGAHEEAAGAGPVFEVIDLNRDALPPGPFDGAFSNFGVLNCVRDRAAFAARLSEVLTPGAPAVFVVMGRCCPWEWIWYAARGRLRTAVRRLGGRATFRGAVVRYPSRFELAREFERHFVAVRTVGIGVLLPPTFAAGLAERHPVWTRRLATAERRIRSRFPATVLNDHYLIEFARR